MSAASDDVALIADLTALLGTGRSVLVCRCAPLGTVEFRRPDGSTQEVRLVPAHDPGSVEFRTRPARFRVDRAEFLRIVAPLGLPADRYYKFPPSPDDRPPGAAEG